ncbi:MAG: PolC-type DNA polymerase III [Oscillospiraceae bacterium]|nr:PolC-type DNA polymerase III [Oscillospiraceae bacterium]
MKTLNELIALDSDVTYEIASMTISRQTRHMTLSLRADGIINDLEALRRKTIEHFQLNGLELTVVEKRIVSGDRAVWVRVGGNEEVRKGEPLIGDASACIPSQSDMPPWEDMPVPAKKQGPPPSKKSSTPRSVKSNGKITRIKDLEPDKRNITIEGTIFYTDNRHSKTLKDTYNIEFGIVDESSAVCVMFTPYRDQKSGGIDQKQQQLSQTLLQTAKKGAYVRLNGMLKQRYNPAKETFEQHFRPTAITLAEPEYRRDNAPKKRVELHLHTTMSAEDATSDVGTLIDMAVRWGHPAIAITDHGVAHSFPDAMKTARDKIKVIYGVEGYLCDNANVKQRDEKLRHVIVLAQNEDGLKNLYSLISDSHTKHFYRRPRYDKTLLSQRREGLLIGAACERGEVFDAILRGVEDEVLDNIARFYDYLEIMPLCNNRFLIDKGIAKDDEDLRDFNRKVVALGERLNIPVVATGDAHFCEPKDEVNRAMLGAKKKYDITSQPFYFRTTEEMLGEFSYLGEEKAYEVVVANSNAIADRIEAIRPIKKGEFFPKIEGSDEELRRLTYASIEKYYGGSLPITLQERVEKELNAIIDNGYAVIYISAQMLIARSEENGYQVGSRGSVGSSIVAFLAGVSEVNSLPPHYRCGQCKAWEFPENAPAACGPDLPDKACPTCGKIFIKDGYDINFSMFLGFNAEKTPDIDLNFSGEYQAEAHKHTVEIFGEKNVYRAGTISTIQENTAFAYLNDYLDAIGETRTHIEKRAMANGIVGVKRSTGQHPGGLVIVREDMDINDFCPVQYPANKADSGMITTHFDYHAIEENLPKLDLLGHDNPTILKMLTDLTGVDSQTVPLDDPAVMSIFSESSALGYQDDEILGQTGAVAVPEFGTNFVRGMLTTAQPDCFDDLIRISGLSHGEMVWQHNAEELIKDGTATIKSVVCARDDMVDSLIKYGMDGLTAFKIMEDVRKGKGLKPEQEAEMVRCQVPRWYIDSCAKIKYLFPKAHATAYVIAAFRIAWYKVHHPLAFYSAYFSIRAKTFDVAAMTASLGEVARYIKVLKKIPRPSALEKAAVEVGEVAYEYAARGFSFLPVDLYQSDASQFTIEDGKLRLPLNVIPSLGDVAAQEIIRERETPFLAVDDLQARCGKLNKAHIEHLGALGALDDLPDTLQVSLF